MAQAKPAIPGMTPGVSVPQFDDVEPGFTPTGSTAGLVSPPVSPVQAPEIPREEQDFFGEKASLNNWAPEMNTLYDTSTGKPTRLKYEDMAPALLEGRVGFRKGTAVPMIAGDGKSYNMPAENVNVALSQGYRLEHPHEIAVREFASNNRGISGAAKAFLTNFADEALFGVPGIVYEHTGEVSDLERAKLQALKKENPLANAAGGIGGFAASMFYGGEFFQVATKGGRVAEGLVKGGQLAERAALGTAEKVIAKEAITEGEKLATQTLVNRMVEQGVKESTAKAVAPGLLRSTAANMAKYGVEGAIISAPKAITEGYYDPALGAEHLAIGIGTGAALGVFGPLGKGFASLSKRMVESVPEKFALSAAGIERASARKLGIDKIDDAAKVLLNEKIIDRPMTFKTLAGRVSAFKEASGEEIGNITREIDRRATENASGQGIRDLFNTNKVIEELDKLRESYNEPIFRKEVKELDRITDTVKKRLVTLETLENQPAGTFISGVSGEQPVSTLSMEKAQELKKMIGDLANWDATAKPGVNNIRREAYHIVRREIDDAVSRVAERFNPELAAAFERAKNNYAAASDISYLINNKEAQTMGNRMIGLTDSIWGGGIGGVAGMAHAIMSGKFIYGLLWPIATTAFKKVLESTTAKTFAATAANRIRSGTEGILFGEQALKYGAEQMDRLLPTLSGRIKKTTPSTIGESAMSRFLGPGAPKNKQEQFQEVAAKINKFNSDPQKAADTIAALAEPIAVGGAPKLSKAYVEQTIKTFQYLQSILPNANKEINPFKKNINQISDQDIMKFERALRIVENPYNIIDSLATGTTTQQEVDTLQAIYPTVHREMINKISELAYSGQAKDLPYQTRLKLSLLMGIRLDQSLQDVSAYQGNFAKVKSGGSGGSGGSKVNIITPKSNPYQTPMQKLIK